MAGTVNHKDWVWVVVEKDTVQKPFLELEGGGALLAMEEETKGLKFIPVFRTQEDGQSGWHALPKKPGAQYELQAMRLDEVAEAARGSRFDIFIVDREGRVMERLAPMADA
ncbi:MAG: hypothetical protein KKB20_18050 [Proteobacteria bacterium]|nr:hypothetical protein [Pseudomonadota bacterium]